MTALQILIGVVAGIFLKDNSAVASLATAGVVVLLFEVGLSIDREELRVVGGRAVRVAAVGATASFVGGFAVMAAFGYRTETIWFVAAALTATSVGIAARVFRHPVVLGAAVVDDVIGLIVLTVALRAVGGHTTVLESLWRLNLVFAFLIGFGIAQTRFRERATKLAAPLVWVLVPVFFFHVGFQLELDRVTGRSIALGLSLFVVAAAAKLLAGRMAEHDHMLVGLGMLPRGEVTLVFAAAGLEQAVFGDSVYAALVFVVLLTTLTASLAFRHLGSA
jgi:Kef-type K+ transport system membrane component KefB